MGLDPFRFLVYNYKKLEGGDFGGRNRILRKVQREERDEGYREGHNEERQIGYEGQMHVVRYRHV